MLARIKALAIAQKELGVKEQPPGSNSGPRIREYQAATSLGGTGWPWCMAFVCWCFKQAGKPLQYPTASVGNFANWARQHDGFVVTRPFRGDCICYRFDAGNWEDHVGFVEKVLALSKNGKPWFVRTVEGNTSFGNDANGGQVQRRWRNATPSRVVFVRIPGDAK